MFVVVAVASVEASQIVDILKLNAVYLTGKLIINPKHSVNTINCLNADSLLKINISLKIRLKFDDRNKTI